MTSAESHLIPLYYYSGTGNTRLAAEAFRDAAQRQGREVVLQDLAAAEGAPKLGDLNTLFYPVYGFGSPRIVRRWARSLPAGNRRRFALILTAAGGENPLNSGAPNVVVRALRRRGYEVPYVRILTMGSNWLQRFPDDFTRQLAGLLPVKCDDILTSLLDGTERRPQGSPVLNAFMRSVAVQEDAVGSRLWGRMLKAGPDCNGCGLCERRCPMGNIRMNSDGRPRFGWSCQWCMRCVYSCPTRALQPRFLPKAAVEGGYDLPAILASPDTGEPAADLAKKREYFANYLSDPAA